MSDPPPYIDASTARPPIGDPCYRPALSTTAIAAFVFSLLLCIPVLSQLVGLILGIAGIVQTGGGRRRGRGFAIAAVCISPLGMLGWAVLGVFVVQFFAALIAVGQNIEPLLVEEEAELPALVAAFRQEGLSARAKARLDDEALLAWVRDARARFGPLREITAHERFVESTADPQTITLRFVAGFPDQQRDLRVTVGIDQGWKPVIDDIQVDDLRLVPDQ